ncbi:MAG: hypothetical protein HC808_04565 [Candidatus Competibacteraceae bacterium]|jgi:hypothetical protein|nr:hypothetical protein [Candidatus Competibacteraceae bacterium]NJN45861.1 hypothetical protein [Candidatus Competibacteraceae bacterium]
MASVKNPDREFKKRQTLLKKRWRGRQDRAKAKVHEKIDTTADDALAEIKAMTEAASKRY